MKSFTMPKVIDCNAAVCAYNKENQCHALAITIGDGVHPNCDTGIITDKKGGVPNMTGKVGACKVDGCQFNTSFECAASEGIHITLCSDHAECGTFRPRG